MGKKLREEQAIMFIMLFSASGYYKLMVGVHSEFGEYLKTKQEAKKLKKDK